jgi:hypothetical protein
MEMSAPEAERQPVVPRRSGETVIADDLVTTRWHVPEDGMESERDEVILPGQPRGRGARRELLQGLAGALVALAWDRSHAAARSDLIGCDATGMSGIAGVVLIGPMCPVMRVDEPCPDQPFAATLLIRDSQGRELCTVASGDDGRFQVALLPESYEVVPLTGSASGLPFAAAQWVAVVPDQYTELTIAYDSGIR